MKTRIGFVSNSSSTSFIVRAKDQEKAKNDGLKLISVKEIKKLIQLKLDVDNQIEKFVEDNGLYSLSFDRFIPDDFDGIDDEDFITAPFDRDVAYLNEMYYEIFLEDL